jgi:hypothetical protein
MKVVSVHKPKQSVLRILHDLELVIAAAILPIPNTTFFDKDQPLSFLSFFIMGCFFGIVALFDAKSSYFFTFYLKHCEMAFNLFFPFQARS